MSFLLCSYFRKELVSSRVLFSPLCARKLFLWKWTGLAGPLIPLCNSISFIKLWHLTCYKGIENSTIWAFQSASFLLKRGVDIWQPPLDSLPYLGCILTKFCENIPFVHQNWKKKWTMVSSYPSEYGLKHPKYSQDWQKESIIISGLQQKIAQAWASTPCNKKDHSRWGERAQCCSQQGRL